jgi:hypothetical protein
MSEPATTVGARASADSTLVNAATARRQSKEFTMTRKLADKVAVVTGGSTGIGLGIAEHFAQEGARVFITGRHRSELDKAVTAIGGNAAALQGDTTNLADLDRIYATVKAQAGHIDVLAANAGVYEFATLGEITEEHFDRTFNTNVRGLLFAVQKALPLLTKGSSVIQPRANERIAAFDALYTEQEGKPLIDTIEPVRHPFRSAGSARPTISARRRYSSLPTTARTSTASSCL